jgi:hypothetical protein
VAVIGALLMMHVRRTVRVHSQVSAWESVVEEFAYSWDTRQLAAGAPPDDATRLQR